MAVEFCAEPPFGTRERGVDGRPAHSHDGCDLPAGESRDVAEQDERAMSFRKGVQCGMDFREFCSCGRPRTIRNRLGWCLLTSPPAADLVEAAEAHTLEQPGPQRAAVAFESVGSYGELQEGLLDGIFRGPPIPQHAGGERSQFVRHQCIHSPKRILGSPTDSVCPVVESGFGFPQLDLR